jgi:WD40 repeat protein
VVTAGWKTQRILRLPIDYDSVGQAYAVAISPDGGTVAVGGWTGAGYGHQNIFLFDRASGALKQRLPNLPATILHLAYSADGRLLAASLSGKNGIRVFDVVNGYGLLPSDTKYEERSMGSHFDKAGRLVTVSDDGFVRLYSDGSYATPVARFEWKGHLPYFGARPIGPRGGRTGFLRNRQPGIRRQSRIIDQH